MTSNPNIVLYSTAQQFPEELFNKILEHYDAEFRFKALLPNIEKNVFSFDEQKNENDPKKLVPTEDEEEEDENEDEEEEEENMQQNYEEQLNELAGVVRGTTKKLIGILVKNPDYAGMLKKIAGEKKRSKIVMDLLTAIEDYYQPFHAKMTTTKEEDIASSQSVNDLKNRISELEKLKKGLQDNLDRDKSTRDEITQKRMAEITKLRADLKLEEDTKEKQLKAKREESETRLEDEKKRFEEEKTALEKKKLTLEKEYAQISKKFKEDEKKAREVLNNAYNMLNENIKGYDDEMFAKMTEKSKEMEGRQKEMDDLKKKEEDFKRIKEAHDLLEKEENEFRKKQEEVNKSLALQNAAAEWIQAHWRRIQAIGEKAYKLARKKAKKAWKKKNKK